MKRAALAFILYLIATYPAATATVDIDEICASLLVGNSKLLFGAEFRKEKSEECVVTWHQAINDGKASTNKNWAGDNASRPF